MVTTLRRAQISDQAQLANLVYFEAHVHRHLDWRTPFEWLGAPEYWVLEENKRLLAALACPPDPQGIAWLRLFVHKNSSPLQESWSALWQTARRELSPGLTLAAIGMAPWLEDLLLTNEFQLSDRVVMLNYNRAEPPQHKPLPAKISLRAMTQADLPAVAALDAAAFAPLWQNSLPALQAAFHLARFAVIATREEELLGYQISTQTGIGAHLARLTVLPGAQGLGIGSALVYDLLEQSRRQNITQVTVNTQEHNQASLALYSKLGFQRTGEEYPVYTYFLSHPPRGAFPVSQTDSAGA